MEFGLAKLAAVYERPQRKNYTELLERLKARRTGGEAELGFAKILGLAKLATSFDARRTKQYWQLLKRLHGGNDEAIQAIKETGDSNIYHGTSAANGKAILKNGLRYDAEQKNDRIYGAGSYFGNRERGDHYSKRRGALLRMARPSELYGTKELYPDVQKMVKFDVQDPVAQMNANNQGLMHHVMKNYGQNQNMELMMKLSDPESPEFLAYTQGTQAIPRDMGLAGLPASHAVQTYGKVPEAGVAILPGQFLSKHEHIPPTLIRRER